MVPNLFKQSQGQIWKLIVEICLIFVLLFFGILNRLASLRLSGKKFSFHKKFKKYLDK